MMRLFAAALLTVLGVSSASAQNAMLAVNSPSETAPSVLDQASQLLAKSSQLATAGQHSEAVQAAQAASDALRSFQAPADAQTAYLWLYTQALYTLTVRLIEAGRLNDAAAAASQTVQISRQAAAAPGADVISIASLMMTLSGQLSIAGVRPAAVDTAQAAADELRGFQPPPDGQAAYLWLFTQALYAWTVRLIEAGRLGEAATAAEQTVQAARQAAAAPGADASPIASLMMTLSGQLSIAGVRPAAVDAAQAAADILRDEGARRQAWTATMSRAPPPNAKGCFNAAYPKLGWQEVPCVEAPNRPYVGNGTDYVANVAAGNVISSATGSFDSVTGVTSETGTTFTFVNGNCQTLASNVPNIFSLQLNTQRFKTSLCSNAVNQAGAQPATGAANPAVCQGWQQFVYSSTSNIIFMQYWLLNYGATIVVNNQVLPACPVGWAPSAGGCFISTPGTPVPLQSIANLHDMSLTAGANTAFDSVKILIAGNTPSVSASNQDSVLNLAPNWQAAEFNVFGDSCNSAAVFKDPAATIVVRTQVNAAGSAPTCVTDGAFNGFTGETNSLNLVGTPATVQKSGSPAIVFTESQAPGTPSSCTVSKSGLACVGVLSSGSTSCTDAGGVASTCASAKCPAGQTLMGGGGACAAGGTRIKSLFPRQSDGSFNIACEQQGVDPQAVAVCCHL
jgi:hypothetical protein